MESIPNSTPSLWALRGILKRYDEGGRAALAVSPTWRWWAALRGVSLLNAVLWVSCLCALGFQGRYALAQVICSAIFVAVCAFRSFFPRIDLERTVMIDHPLSGIVLGRSAATLAEMAFTVQSALVLAVLADVYRVPWVGTIALILVPLIAVAQLACWVAVATLNHLWHGVEEALWTVYVVLVGAAFVGIWPQADAALRALLGLGILGCAGSVVLMSGIDVPMYVKRWREGRARGERLLGPLEGVRDALHRREPSQSWDLWRHEVPWMSLYFSSGVWLSLVMAWAPLGS